MGYDSSKDINVKFFLNKIEQDLKDIVSNFIFETRDDYLKEIVKKQIISYLEIVKKHSTFYNYEIDVKLNNEIELNWLEKIFPPNGTNNKLDINITITPNNSIDFIKLDFEIK